MATPSPSELVDLSPDLSTVSSTLGRRIAKKVAYFVDDRQAHSGGVVVLAYHRVGGRTPSPVDLAEARFREQMEFVAERAVDLDSALDMLEDEDDGTKVDPHDNPVVVTFDDGTADFVEVALPILVEFRIPTVLYLSTANVDSGASYPADGIPISWAGLIDCLDTGIVTIGAHTHDHLMLDRCSRSEAIDQLDRCDGRIEDELDIRPRHFAYPKAVAPSHAIDRIVRTRYESAAVAGTKANTIGVADRYLLNRSPIQNADGWEGFVRKSHGRMRIEDDVRRTVNSVRYRGKTS